MPHHFPDDSICPVEKRHWDRIRPILPEYQTLWEGYIGSCEGDIQDRPYGLSFTPYKDVTLHTQITQLSEQARIRTAYLHLAEASYSVFCNLAEALNHADVLASIQGKPYSEALGALMDELASIYDRLDRVGNALDQLRQQAGVMIGLDWERDYTNERRALFRSVDACGNYIRHGDRLPHIIPRDKPLVPISEVQIRQFLPDGWAIGARKVRTDAEEIAWTDIHTLNPIAYPWIPAMEKVQEDLRLVGAACRAEYKKVLAGLEKSLPERGISVRHDRPVRVTPQTRVPDQPVHVKAAEPDPARGASYGILPPGTQLGSGVSFLMGSDCSATAAGRLMAQGGSGVDCAGPIFKRPPAPPPPGLEG